MFNKEKYSKFLNFASEDSSRIEQSSGYHSAREKLESTWKPGVRVQVCLIYVYQCYVLFCICKTARLTKIRFFMKPEVFQRSKDLTSDLWPPPWDEVIFALPKIYLFYYQFQYIVFDANSVLTMNNVCFG